MDGQRERLETALRNALERAGTTETAVESVMTAGCRLDGLGAGAVPEQLRQAGDRLQRRIRALAAALDRVDAGTYGQCQVCGGAIDPERLEVLPTATRCRRHTS